ncbi:unnamed protein product [Oncorhynchus mykiss]|uniref:Uncharacterized protein n=1 Tax=Oncorhynchus mykiss TaxID=8022 RepID=A0A060W0V6_ONCMY|nr:unnamed protein product [Oncorhynchus mykiss]
MIVSHLLLILHKKYSFISLCLKPEMWQKVAKFKGAEYFRKALYVPSVLPHFEQMLSSMTRPCFGSFAALGKTIADILQSGKRIGLNTVQCRPIMPFYN